MHLTMNDNTRIYVNDIGEGQPVILIHGWPLNADMWEYQTHALVEAGYRVISYDRRGFGRSSQNFTAYTYDIFANDLHEIIEQLDLEKVALVGFSMGGGEIARYVGLYGTERVSSTVLIGSITPFLLKTGSNPDGVEEKEFDNMIHGLLQDRPAFLAQFSKTFYGIGWVMSPVSKEILEWTHFLAFQSSLKACIDCVSAFGKTDFRADMAAFNIPTLIIHGSDDRTVPITPSAKQAAAMIRHARLKVYEGAPHGLFITHKKELTEDLLMFLNSELTRAPYRSLNESTVSTILN